MVWSLQLLLLVERRSTSESAKVIGVPQILGHAFSFQTFAFYKLFFFRQW